jgi:hypothetical protein
VQWFVEVGGKFNGQVNEICDVVGLSAAWVGCPETSVRNCHSTLLRKIPEARRFHLHRGGILRPLKRNNV